MLSKFHIHLITGILCLLPLWSSAINLRDIPERGRGFLITGVDSGDRMCAAAARAGDVNGDGLSDMIIGAPNGGNRAGVDGPGEAYVLFGSTQLDENTHNISVSGINGNNGFVVLGTDAGDEIGSTVAPAGDVNADGLDDVLIGAPNADQVMVMFGRNDSSFPTVVTASQFVGQTGLLLNGVTANGRAGHSIGGAGDVNGDGIDDIIIGAPLGNGETSSSGVVYVVFGSSELNNLSEPLDLGALDGDNGFALYGINESDDTGESVAIIKDINGDNIDDIFIGAGGTSTNNTMQTGRAYLIFGKRTSFPAVFNLSELNSGSFEGLVINGSNTSENLAAIARGLRDVNGDGKNDLIMSGVLTESGVSLGKITVLFGGRRLSLANGALTASDLTGRNGFNLRTIDALNPAGGGAISDVGDVNGDGFNDFIAGSAGIGNSGTAFLFFGGLHLSGTNGRTDLFAFQDRDLALVFEGPTDGDNAGSTVAGVGDINGDGTPDVLIGAEGTNGVGACYVLFGRDGFINVALDDFGIDASTLSTIDATQLESLPDDLMEAFKPDTMRLLPVEAFAGFTTSKVAKIGRDVWDAVTPEQFQNIPLSALAGLGRQRIGGLPADVLDILDNAALASLNANEFKIAASTDVSRILGNVNAARVDPVNFQRLLPDGWSIDTNTGAITPPTGARLKFRQKTIDNTLPQLILPSEIPDLSSSFGLGGIGGDNLLAEINAALVAFGLDELTVEQSEDGVLQVKDNVSDAVLLSYIVDVERIFQTFNISTPGITLDEDSGRIVIITPSHKRIALLPAPRNPADLLPLLGDNSEISVGVGGDVHLRMMESDGSVTQQVVLFSPVITAAVPGAQPGIFITNPTARGGVPIGQVVYGNGSAQQIFPYIPEPNTFITTVLSLSPDIDSAIMNVTDGTATVVLIDEPLLLTPFTTTLVKTLTADETVTPLIVVNPDLSLSYTVQELNNELLTQIGISF